MCVYLLAVLTGDGKIPNIEFSTIKQIFLGIFKTGMNQPHVQD